MSELWGGGLGPRPQALNNAFTHVGLDPGSIKGASKAARIANALRKVPDEVAVRLVNELLELARHDGVFAFDGLNAQQLRHLQSAFGRVGASLDQWGRARWPVAEVAPDAPAGEPGGRSFTAGVDRNRRTAEAVLTLPAGTTPAQPLHLQATVAWVIAVLGLAFTAAADVSGGFSRSVVFLGIASCGAFVYRAAQPSARQRRALATSAGVTALLALIVFLTDSGTKDPSESQPPTGQSSKPSTTPPTASNGKPVAPKPTPSETPPEKAVIALIRVSAAKSFYSGDLTVAVSEISYGDAAHFTLLTAEATSCRSVYTKVGGREIVYDRSGWWYSVTYLGPGGENVARFSVQRGKDGRREEASCR